MDVIDDVNGAKKEILECIKKNGFAREHNFWFFCNQQNDYAKAYFFKFDGYGLFAIRYKSGIWEFIGEVLAPEEKRLRLFWDFLDFVLLNKKDKKAFTFIPERFYNEINDRIKTSGGYKIVNDPIIYTTPVFNLKKWDEGLKGSEWKKLRNIRNQFFKLHDAEIIPCKELEKEKLLEVANQWRKNRPKAEMNYYTDMYLNFVKNGFEGCDIARSVVVDGNPCTITAGWSIPNTKNYYSAIGLYNYSYPGLGEIANIDDLTQIKEKKIEFADFGDSTESLLQFKRKFRPESFYRTYWFHIKRK